MTQGIQSDLLEGVGQDEQDASQGGQEHKKRQMELSRARRFARRSTYFIEKCGAQHKEDFTLLRGRVPRERLTSREKASIVLKDT